VLMRNGPTGGSLSDVVEGNTIACGVDMVALDSYGYTELLKRNLNELGYVNNAHERGLGNKNWKSLNYREIKFSKARADNLNYFLWRKIDNARRRWTSVSDAAG